MNSRIGQEILDKIWQLKRGSQKVSPKIHQNHFIYVSELSIHKNKAFEISNFGHFFSIFFNSTYEGINGTCESDSGYIFTFLTYEDSVGGPPWLRTSALEVNIVTIVT
jgi:hypothetical protein